MRRWLLIRQKNSWRRGVTSVLLHAVTRDKNVTEDAGITGNNRDIGTFFALQNGYVSSCNYQ